MTTATETEAATATAGSSVHTTPNSTYTSHTHTHPSSSPHHTSTSPKGLDLGHILRARSRKDSTASTSNLSGGGTSKSGKIPVRARAVTAPTPTIPVVEREEGKDKSRSPRILGGLGMGGKLTKRRAGAGAGAREGKTDLKGSLSAINAAAPPALTFPIPPIPSAHLQPRPAPIHRLQAHRRSRSFSELLSNLSSLSGTPQTLSTHSSTSKEECDQPWRSRETWLALHHRTTPADESERPSMDLRTNGGWRQRSKAELFGTDMSVPLRMAGPNGNGRKMSVGSVCAHGARRSSHEGQQQNPQRQPPALLGPALNLEIPRHRHRHPPHLGHEGAHPPPSWPAESDSQFSTLLYGNDENELPPLLPLRLGHADTGRTSPSPSFIDGSPVPWAQSGAASGSGRASPNFSLRLRTPTTASMRAPFVRSESGSGPSPSPLAETTGGRWQRTRTPSPPHSLGPAASARKVVLYEQRPTPLTPPGSPLRPERETNGKAQRQSQSPKQKEKQVVRRSTSPIAAAERTEEKGNRHAEVPRSTSGRFWSTALGRRKGRVTG